MNPLFSIILPTYNRSQLLARAILSVLQQIFTDFELIIVDDYSTDTTKQTVAEFADERIVYIQQPENKGVSAARNAGIQYANGAYFCFLDDDDEYYPNYLKEIQLFLEKKQIPFVGIIWTGIAKIYAPNNLATKNEKIETELFILDNDKLFLLKVPLSGITIHRGCFERVGLFNLKLRIKEDTDIIFRIVDAGFDYSAIPQVLVKIHIHEYPSLSRSIDSNDKIENLAYFLVKYDEFLNKHLSLWLYSYKCIVGSYYHNGKKAQARKLVFHICKKKWFSPKIWEIYLRFELITPLKSVLLKFFRL